MNPTEQRDGIMFRQACQTLSKLRIGTTIGLIHSVVTLTNPEWSVVRSKTERFFISRAQGHSHGLTINPTLFSFERDASLFLLTSESASFVIETANDRLDRTR